MNIVESSRRIDWGGALGWPAAAVMLVLLMAVAILLLSRERRITGTATSLLFLSLRVASLAVVLWMLLAPSDVLTDREQIARPVVVAVDVSASMTSVDAPDDPRSVRWSFAAGTVAEQPLLRACDRALVAAGSARRHLEQMILVRQELGLPSGVDPSLNLYSKSLNRLRRRAVEIANLAVGGLAERSAAQVAEGVDTTLLDAAASSDTDTDRMEEAVMALRGIEHTLGRLSQTAFVPDAGPRGEPVSSSSSTRQEQVSALLAHIESNMLPLVERESRLTRLIFDQRATLVESWDAARPPAGIPLPIDRTESASDAPVTNASSPLLLLRDDDNTPAPACIILISDFAHNDPSARDPRDVVADLAGVPVHTVPIGSAEALRDVILHTVVAPSVVMAGDDLVVEAHLQACDCAGEVCSVELQQGDDVVRSEHVGDRCRRRESPRRAGNEPVGNRHTRIRDSRRTGRGRVDRSQQRREIHRSRHTQEHSPAVGRWSPSVGVSIPAATVSPG